MDAPVSMPPMFGASLIVPVLLAGGVGSRLWPLSREAYPKQFLSLLGANSLLQDSALRSAHIEQAASPIVIGAEAHRFVILDQLERAGVRGATVVLEPEGRNTAPAAAVAAQLVAEEYGPEAIVFLMAADHAIRDQARFVEAVTWAADAATQGYIVTFGIKPTRAETGFGYLKAGARLGTLNAFDVEAFVEKPSAERAQEFLARGGYFWNGGMFLFRSGRYLAELRRLEAEMYHHALEAVSNGRRDGAVLTLDAKAFRACRSDSIDYAVMEKTEELALVPLDADWDDVGSWSFYDKLPADDAAGNRTRGDVLLNEAHDNVVHAESRLVALVGVSDHVVVETEDAVLVAHKDRVQDVKSLVQQLKAGGRSEALSHRRVYRPWGYYETIGLGERFQVKHISVNPGQKLSLQMHYHRAEHWVVVHGTARVTCGDRSFILTEDQSTYIPLGNTHRLENPGKVPLELIEVQSGAYLGEDDIVRFSDVYGRTEPAEPQTRAAETATTF
jgi:mannose-1-phosphate guanylyltransferase/mannose-6-phosphate isomerase